MNEKKENTAQESGKKNEKRIELVENESVSAEQFNGKANIIISFLNS